MQIKHKTEKHLAVGAAVCQNVSLSPPFAQTALLANVDSNESLAWFQASGFCYTIKTGTTLVLLLVSHCYPVPWRSCSFWFCRDSAFPQFLVG